MSLSDKLKSFISSKLYYSQPVYVPGYKYSPWKKWVVASAVLLLLVVLAILFINSQSNTTNTSVKAEQTNTEVRRPIDGVSETEPTAPPETNPISESNCDSNYSPCVPLSKTDLNCADIGFSVRVIGSDPHGFDREGDGYGCESY